MPKNIDIEDWEMIKEMLDIYMTRLLQIKN